MKVVIDPTEDLFSYSPSLRKLIGESKVPSLPQPTNAEVFETLDSGPINPTNANLGFSMFNGNITRRTGKKLTVYQLLLDSQLELRRLVQQTPPSHSMLCLMGFSVLVMETKLLVTKLVSEEKSSVRHLQVQ